MDLVRPLPARRGDDRQFIRHVLRFADDSPHAQTGRIAPFLRHHFAGVTAPAPHRRVAGKDAAIDLRELTLMQERFRRAVDVAAVVEHETGFVRVSEIFQKGDLHLIARLPII